MPTPNKGEKQKDFISRCIPIVMDEGTTDDSKQAAAICYSKWEDSKKSKNSVDDMSNINLSADVKTFADEGADKPYDFELVGYTGKPMAKMDWEGIFSLDGMEAKGGKVIILREHERDRIVGYGDVIKDERGFVVRGKFSKTTKDGQEVSGLLAEGVPLQCSVGIAPMDVRAAAGGESINGFSVKKGMQIWDKSYVGEVSVCSWGVDTDTSVHSFAKEIEMPEEIKELCNGDCGCGGDCGDDCVCKSKEGDETPVEPAETEATTEETTEEKPAEIPTSDKELKFSQADIDSAIAGERARVAAIFSADAPIELAKEAVISGMSEGDAYKFFWQSEKGMKVTGLKEMAASAPVVESEKAQAEELQLSNEMGYMELIAKVKDEQKCSTVDATKYVMKNHPEAYKKFMGK